ncbi:hypothetical protein XNA1_4840028 [Xenorhabdus nematophila str. Anatoliense]|nr:hypothetical protein XNA1_4840028 [Xenorhabdus nematophila str. Anatoliense]
MNQILLKYPLEPLRFGEVPLAIVAFTLLYIVPDYYHGILISRNHLS